jgi:hypothetical protein
VRPQLWLGRHARRALAATVLAAAPAGAQLPDSTGARADSTRGDSARVGGPATVSPVVAGVFEYFVPLAGHAYAGDVRRGLWPLALTAAGVGVMIWDTGRCDSNLGCGYLLHGAALTVAGRLWGVQSAVSTALRRNRRAEGRSRFRVGVAPLVAPRGLQVSIGF